MCNLFMSKEDNTMRKHLKSIAAAFMVVVMLMNISTSAMAAEQIPAVGETEVSEASTRAVLGEIGPQNMYLQAGRVISQSLYIIGAARTVQHKLVGNSTATRGQTVVIRFQNLSTGETRSFTAVSNQGWLSDTYNTSFPEGNYMVWVIYASADGNYNVNIKFLS